MCAQASSDRPPAAAIVASAIVASAMGGDHECPDTAFDRAAAKATLQSVGCMLCRILQPGCVPSFDLVPKRSALTVGNRRIECRGRLADGINGFDGNMG